MLCQLSANEPSILILAAVRNLEPMTRLALDTNMLEWKIKSNPLEILPSLNFILFLILNSNDSPIIGHTR